MIGHASGCVKINCSGCGTDFYSIDYSGVTSPEKAQDNVKHAFQQEFLDQARNWRGLSKAAERNTAEPAKEVLQFESNPFPEASGTNASAVEVMRAESVAREVLRSIATTKHHEPKLATILPIISDAIAEAEARGRREALEKTDYQWLSILIDVLGEYHSHGNLEAARDYLKKRMMTGEK